MQSVVDDLKDKVSTIAQGECAAYVPVCRLQFRGSGLQHGALAHRVACVVDPRLSFLFATSFRWW